MKQYCKLQIIISQQNTIQINYININNNTSQPIQIHNGIDTYPISIAFEMNEIHIGEERKDNVQFLDELIEHPNELNKYTFEYQGIEYKVIAEVLFALIVDHFKQSIEKEWIISSVSLIVPSTFSQKTQERLKYALVALHLIIENDENVNDIEEDQQEENEEEIEMYKEQGELLQEIQLKKNDYQKYKRSIELASLRVSQEYSSLIPKPNEQPFNSEKLYSSIGSLPQKEVERISVSKLDNYCLFIASKYFKSLQDHINLTFVCKRMRGNMEKFHFNPISVDKNTIHLFPNVETLNLYSISDEKLKQKNIIKYCDWRETKYTDTLHDSNYDIIQTENSGKEIKLNTEFKQIVFTSDDLKYFKNKHKQSINSGDKCEKSNIYTIQIPEGVKIIDNLMWYDYKNLKLILPNSITMFREKCFIGLNCLRELTLPLPPKAVIYGNKIFVNDKTFKQYIVLPENIMKINDIAVDKLTSLVIPNDVTKIEPNTFKNCHLEHLEILNPEIEMEFDIFKNLGMLNSLKLTKEFIYSGDKIFIETDGKLSSIQLPYSLTKLNEIEVHIVKNYTLVIPSTVTSLHQNCLKNCVSLTHLEFPSTIKEIPSDYISHLTQLKQLCCSFDGVYSSHRFFKEKDGKLSYIIIPSSVRSIVHSEVNTLPMYTHYTIPQNVVEIDDNCFEGCELSDLSIPSTVTNLKYNSLLKLSNLQTLEIEGEWTFNGDRIFTTTNGILSSIQLPSTIQRINKSYVCWKQLENYTIPSNVTKIDDYCFVNCKNLTTLNGLENIKEFGIGCFFRSEKLEREEYKTIINETGKKHIKVMLNENEQQQIEKLTSSTIGQPIFDSDIDGWPSDPTELNKHILNKENLLFIIQDENDVFGCFISDKFIQSINQKEQENNNGTNQVSENNTVSHQQDRSSLPLPQDFHLFKPLQGYQIKLNVTMEQIQQTNLLEKLRLHIPNVSFPIYIQHNQMTEEVNHILHQNIPSISFSLVPIYQQIPNAFKQITELVQHIQPETIQLPQQLPQNDLIAENVPLQTISQNAIHQNEEPKISRRYHFIVDKSTSKIIQKENYNSKPYQLYSKSFGNLIRIGDISLFVSQLKSKCQWKKSSKYSYNQNVHSFIPKRLLIVQMKESNIKEEENNDTN